MRRYLSFLFVLMPVGFLLPYLCILEGWVPALYVLYTRYHVDPTMLRRVLTNGFNLNDALKGALAAAIIAIAAASWARVRHIDQRGSGIVSTLLFNLAWCGLYGFIVIMVNAILFGVLLSRIPIATLTAYPYNNILQEMPFVFAALVNIFLVLWATLRSINTGDVLTPRALMGKMQLPRHY